MAANNPLHKAKQQKKDNFYTQLPDIEKEMRHYADHFRDKVVFCNCDDPRVSNFFRYFQLKFRSLGLRKLITTCYQNQNPDMFSRHIHERSIGLAITEKGSDIRDLPNIDLFNLEGDGDFRSDECVELLKQADIVVTNPPFSLFREYVAQLVEYNKQFVIIGSWNAVTYKEIFPLIKNNRMWLGYGFNAGNAYFAVSSDVDESFAAGVYDANTGLVKFRNVTWFTNLDYAKRHEDLILYRRYSQNEYPKYDNYDAINVDKVAHIPVDYAGEMGVPVTFLDKHNPDQFEILSANDIRTSQSVPFKEHGLIKDKDSAIGGKPKYVRIVIKRKVV